MVIIQPVTTLTLAPLQPLLNASLIEGYDFVERLWREYDTGINRFNRGGAVLMGGYDGDTASAALIAIGGVQMDPYEQQATIGRIRHVYVMPDYRRLGVGRRLLQALIDHAYGHYQTLTLRTRTDHGHAFYTSLGFSAELRYADATHWLDIEG